MIYYLAFSISLCFFSIYGLMRRWSFVKFNGLDVIFLCFCSLPIVVLSGIRGINVGTDTDLYYSFYVDYENISLPDFFESLSFFNEPLFKLVQYVFSNQFGLPFNVYLMACTFFITMLSFNFILRSGYNPFIAIVVFLFMGFATIHFNILRQCIAIALSLLAVRCYLNNCNLKLLAVIFLGLLIHKSFAFVACSLLLFNFLNELNLKSIFVISSVFAIFVLFIDYLVTFAIGIDSRYILLGEANSQGLGQNKFILSVLIFAFAYFNLKINPTEDRLLKYSVFALFISLLLNALTVILSLNPNGITRASLYFEFFVVFVVADFIFKIDRPYLRITTTFLMIFSLIFYFWIFVLPYGELYPFVFWSE